MGSGKRLRTVVSHKDDAATKRKKQKSDGPRSSRKLYRNTPNPKQRTKPGLKSAATTPISFNAIGGDKEEEQDGEAANTVFSNQQSVQNVHDSAKKAQRSTQWVEKDKASKRIQQSRRRRRRKSMSKRTAQKAPLSRSLTESSLRPAPLSALSNVQENDENRNCNRSRPPLQSSSTMYPDSTSSSISHTQSLNDVQQEFSLGDSRSSDHLQERGQSVPISSADTTQSNSSVSASISPLEPMRVAQETQSLESSRLRFGKHDRKTAPQQFFRDIAEAMDDHQEWMTDTSRPPQGMNDPDLPSFMLGPATVPPTPEQPKYGGGFTFGRGFGGGADDWDDIICSAEKVKSHNMSRHGVIPETPMSVSGSGAGASCIKADFTQKRTKGIRGDDIVKKISFG